MAPPAIVKQTVARKGIGKKRRIDENHRIRCGNNEDRRNIRAIGCR